MYRLLFERVLARFDPERMHKLGFGLLRALLCLPFVRRLVRKWTCPPDPALVVEAFGRTLDSPLGLAAGFDKDAVGYEQLYALGFGFIEIGTLTGEAQPGNPRPRMFRFVHQRALINRLGFNNRGSRAAVARLSRARDVPLGVNIGKTKLVPEDQAVADYVASAERLGGHADYVVVNVSSPNTPGLRNLQAVELLRPLLSAVRATLDRVAPTRHVPLLVKIAPDLADDDVDAVAALALELSLDGIIATNTTISRAPLSAEEAERAGAGGLSGAPLKARSLAVLKRLYARVGSHMILIGVGGVESADDVLQRILAGATLVQAYTGFIYGGPRWPAQVRRELGQLLRERGYANVRDAVGRG
ncbi:MAG: dihydroorotate oxidase [Myxococcaceae bacterium]|nr:dihydroorotate oxidase [Myxococcaceae bacterium]